MEGGRDIQKTGDVEADLSRLDTKNTSTGEVLPLERHQTKRGLKSRHSQMIALGGTIGTGLFVGSGQALRMGGPLALLLAYVTLSVFVFGIVTATTEFSSYLCVPGSTVAYYGNRFFSRSMGFALGWMYWYICIITVPAEITAGSIVISYWDSPVHIAVWITILLVVIVALNCFPVSVYGETEFWFASTKVMGIIGLIIMAIVITSGGGPNGKVIGFSYWNNPGAINEYLTTGNSGRVAAFVGTLCFSAFAFVFAPEMLVITGGEMQNPRKNLPLAGQRYVYRLVLFYVLGAFFLGMIIPSNDPNLLGGGKGAGASPWSIAARNAGIKGLDSVINAIILLSAWSAGNAWLYMGTRALYSLSIVGIAPKIFRRCTASGIPYTALAFSASFSLLSYMNASKSAAAVFNWFVNLINCSGFISWICVCSIYLRFRKATFAQEIQDLPYRSIFQPYAAYVCIVFFTVLMLLNGFANFFPGHWDTSNFITSYFGMIFFFCFYFGHKFIADRQSPWLIPPKTVDLHSGLQELLDLEETAPAPKNHKWYMFWRFLFE